MIIAYDSDLLKYIHEFSKETLIEYRSRKHDTNAIGVLVVFGMFDKIDYLLEIGVSLTDCRKTPLTIAFEKYYGIRVVDDFSKWRREKYKKIIYKFLDILSDNVAKSHLNLLELVSRNDDIEFLEILLGSHGGKNYGFN